MVTMIKPLVATGSVCLAVGSALGYVIADLTKPPLTAQIAPTTAPIATTKPTTAPINRGELEKRFNACIGRNMKLDQFTDKQINDDLFECESQRKPNSNR